MFETSHLCLCTVFLKYVRSFVLYVSSSFAESSGGHEGYGGKSILLEYICRRVNVLVVRLILQNWRQEGRCIFDLVYFGIQCVYVHGFTVVCTCAMFHVICNRVCAGLVRGTIAKMLCICYHQGFIVLAVWSDYFFFHRTWFSLILSDK